MRALSASRRTAAAVGLCALVAFAGVGCDTEKSCKPGTVFVQVEPGSNVTANELWIDVSVSGGAPVRSVLSIPSGSRGGGVEIDFPSGYPSGQSVEISVSLVANGVVLSTRMTRTV